MSEEEKKDIIAILANTDISCIELAENVDLLNYQKCVNGLLYLYVQEKEKNKELEIIIGEYKNACDNVCETTQNMINNLYISKSKLKDLLEQSNAHPVKLYSDIKELLGE